MVSEGYLSHQRPLWSIVERVDAATALCVVIGLAIVWTCECAICPQHLSFVTNEYLLALNGSKVLVPVHVGAGCVLRTRQYHTDVNTLVVFDGGQKGHHRRRKWCLTSAVWGHRSHRFISRVGTCRCLYECHGWSFSFSSQLPSFPILHFQHLIVLFLLGSIKHTHTVHAILW